MVSMFLNILKITENIATVAINKGGQMMPDLMNMHVVFESGNMKVLGEVKNILDNAVEIKFLGEFLENGFRTGIVKKPSLSSRIRMINELELQALIGTKKPDNFLLGYSPLYITILYM